MIEKIRAILIAVRDFDAAAERYATVLGLKPKIIIYEGEGIKVASFSIGESEIELISPLKTGIPIDKFINTRGEGVFAISLQVTDIDNDMKELTERGLRFLTEEPLIDELGTRYAYTHPKSMHGVEFELSQPRG